MNIDQVETFIIIAEIGNLTKTAEILRITQPAVTARINNLEAELNCKLFIQRGRKLLLSQAGELFLPYARRILDEVTQAKNAILHMQKQTMIVGFPPNFANDVISRVLSLGHRAGVVPSIYRGIDSNDLVDQVCNDTITMAFVHGRVVNDSLYVQRIWNVGLLFLVGTAHPLAKLPRITREQLGHETLVCYKRNTKIWQTIDRELRDIPLDTIEVNDVATVKTLVKNGLGFTILPEFSVDDTELHEFHICPFTTTRPWDSDLYVIYKSALLKNPFLHARVQQVVELLRTSLSGTSEWAV